MKIDYQINFDDILALQLDVIKHSYTHQIKKTYFKWISAIILFVLIWLVFQMSFVSALVGIVLSAALVLIFPVLYEKIAIKKAEGQMRQQDYSGIIGPCTMTLTEEGIKRDKDGTVTHFNWDEFIKLGEDNDHYFLYKTDLQGLILPKEPGDQHLDDISSYQKQIISHVDPDGSTKVSSISENKQDS